MSWTRSLGARLAALLAATALVAVHWSDRGTWFWVGAALLVLNLLGLAHSRANGSASESDATSLGLRARASTRAGESLDGTEVVLAHLDAPEVVAAFEEGPDDWVQVSHLDDDRDECVVAPRVTRRSTLLPSSRILRSRTGYALVRARRVSPSGETRSAYGASAAGTPCRAVLC